MAADAGTTDAGPYALGSGECAFAREAVASDLEAIILGARARGIPVLIGSCGTAGADIQVDWCLDIVREIAGRHRTPLRVALVYAEQPKSRLAAQLALGQIRPLDPAPPFDAGTIDRADRIVGMMGIEPLQAALAEKPDVVLAGRCSDSALFAAVPVLHGRPAGLSWHMGKVIECGPLACVTKGPGVMLGVVRDDHAIIRPIGPNLACTPQSIAAHSLYENGDPWLHRECSGTLDITDAVFTQEDATSVRITGSRFIPASPKTVKLEGAEPLGHQTLMIGGIRDPFLLDMLDEWLAGVRRATEKAAADLLADRLRPGEWRMDLHLYGRDAVMGAQERDPRRPHEVGVVATFTAPTQALATKLAQLARQPFLHNPIPKWRGAITTIAYLLNPAHVERGPVWRFCANHVVEVEDPMELFRLRTVQVG
ncbi:DUF1446 domain-containing protein [Roseomonas sp. OT10]|uniref:acyclic terpene utilization AtuA family protein n=1 Tax=Roseomonas cutis TaxID=2897332 RepID=UPI001E495957|nr:acyclic terpene utilization AtuA family protein [Roseomonas sp. OT10]UFN50862.1 DUF1446 domain-containing protein [Roseomonas sp. OT10]